MSKSAPAHAFRRTESLRGKASARRIAAIEVLLRTGGWVLEPVDALEIRGELYILDGHHRVAAARRAGVEVVYRLAEADDLSRFRFASVEEVRVAHAEVAPNRLPPTY